MRLKSAESGEARKAVQEIFTTYRYPLYGYLRASGLRHEDAEDVLQGFFEKMLRNDSLGDADPARGRLRTFLLTTLSRYKLNFQRSEQRRHQRVQAESDLWDEDEACWKREQHATHENPEAYYDRRWAVQLISHVRERLRQNFEAKGRGDLLRILVPLLLRGNDGPDDLSHAAAALGLSDNATRVALHRLRRHFRELLLDEVKRTLDPGEDARAEIQHLLRYFE